MDEVQAVILSKKLKTYNLDLKRREQISKFYLKNILNPKIILPKVNSKFRCTASLCN